jgi:hypothetical protein
MAVNLYTLSLHGLLYGQEVVNTFSYQQTVGEEDGEALVHLASAWGNGFLDEFLECCASDYNLENLRVQQWDHETGQVHRSYETIAFNNFGLWPDDPAMPGQVAVVINRYGEFASKQNRGRIYVPAIPKTPVVDGAIGLASPYYTKLLDLAAAMIGQLQWPAVGPTRQWKPVLLRHLSNDKPPPRVLATPIVRAEPNRFPRTIRRRAIGIGD